MRLSEKEKKTNTRGRFRRAWLRLAQAGLCAPVDSSQYEVAREAWIAAGEPREYTLWIRCFLSGGTYQEE